MAASDAIMYLNIPSKRDPNLKNIVKQPKQRLAGTKRKRIGHWPVDIEEHKTAEDMELDPT